MKYLAAYALLSLSGNNSVTAADIKKVLGDAQINVEESEVNRLIESVKGKKIQDLIAEGSKQIGACGPAPAAGSAPAAKTEAPKADNKKAAKVEAPPKEEQEDVGMGGLFD